MARKKILWLCSWYPNKMEPFNGDFIQRHANAAALYNDIHVIHVAGDSGGTTSRKQEIVGQSPGLTEQIIYFPMTASFVGRLIANYSWLLIFRKEIRKYIAEQGKPDLIHIHIPYKAGLQGLWAKKKFGIPYLVTEHWTIYQPQNIEQYEQQPAFLRSVLRRVIKGCTRLLPVSNDLGSLMNKKLPGKEFTVIENVANEKYFYYNGPVRKDAPFRFIHVSNMTYQKNAEGIIESFTEFQQNFQDTELVIVGSVSAPMKELIDKTSLLDKKIFLRGEISYQAVAGEMQQANALVMFSRFENSPCSIIEALCCGLPVIGTKVGGIPELIDEKNGLLIGSLDKKALTAALKTMVSSYATYDREKIATAANQQFSYPVIGKKLDEVYALISPGSV